MSILQSLQDAAISARCFEGQGGAVDFDIVEVRARAARMPISRIPLDNSISCRDRPRVSVYDIDVDRSVSTRYRLTRFGAVTRNLC